MGRTPGPIGGSVSRVPEFDSYLGRVPEFDSYLGRGSGDFYATSGPLQNNTNLFNELIIVLPLAFLLRQLINFNAISQFCFCFTLYSHIVFFVIFFLCQHLRLSVIFRPRYHQIYDN